MAPTRSSHTWTALALAGIAGFIGPSLACDKGKKDAPQPGASEPSAAKGNPDKPAVPASGPPRCDDFFTKDEIKALGLNAERYSEVASTNDAVTCTLGGVSAVIWRADRYSSVVDGIAANGEKTGVAVEDGPKIGAQTQWITMAGVHGIDGKSPHTVNFLSPSKKFTAAVSGTDKAKVEQVANALLAKFEKP